MKEQVQFRSVRMWRQTYVSLKILAAMRGVTFVQLVDDLTRAALEAEWGSGLTGAKAQHESDETLVRFQSPPT